MIAVLIFLSLSLELTGNFLEKCCREELGCSGSYKSLAVQNVFRIKSIEDESPHLAVAYEDIGAIVSLTKYRGNMEVEKTKQNVYKYSEEHLWGYAYACNNRKMFRFTAAYWYSHVAVMCEYSRYLIKKFYFSDDIDLFHNVSTIETNCGKEDSHPVFCQRENLLDFVVVPTTKEPRGIRDSFVIGFYAHKQQLGKRTYTVKSWRGEDKDTSIEFKVDGFLSSIEIYETTDDSVKGIYFTTDGNACFFEKTFKDIATEEFEFEDTKPVRAPCRAFQEFLGCRRPFCFDPRFEASFTVTQSKTYMYFIANNYLFWADRPRHGSKVSIEHFGNANRLKNANFDRMCGNNVFKLCFIPKYTKATFSFTVTYPTRHEYIVFLRENDGASLFVVRSDSYNFNFNKRIAITSDIKIQNADTAWFDSKKNIVYFINDNQWVSYDSVQVYFWLQGTPKPFTHIKSGTLQDFGMNETHIDAVAAIRSKGYFFVNGWYYEIAKGSTKVKPEKNLALTDFFNIKDHCYKNNSEPFDELVRRYNYGMYRVKQETTVQTTYRSTTEVTTTKLEPTQRTKPSSTFTTVKTGVGRKIVLILVTLILLIIAITLLLFYICTKEERRKQRQKRLPKRSVRVDEKSEETQPTDESVRALNGRIEADTIEKQERRVDGMLEETQPAEESVRELNEKIESERGEKQELREKLHTLSQSFR